MQIPTGTTVAEITKSQWPLCFIGLAQHTPEMEQHNSTSTHAGNTGALLLSFRRWEMGISCCSQCNIKAGFQLFQFLSKNVFNQASNLNTQ